ncbi:MAG: hypothetical protein ACT6S0_10770 [Roseateles sp.]|uniref:hypothetical protein n=1 Tax=Roseateles sp. TaxID=1971397 RepID=UPI0040358FA0
MTGPNTFLADLIRGIAASAPPSVEDGFFESQGVFSHDPLGFFESSEVAGDRGQEPQAGRDRALISGAA